jgi:hypothetical protein
MTNWSARQRTYEAAYWRTAIGQFSFAAIVLSIFQSAFYPIGGDFHKIDGGLIGSPLLCVCHFDGSCFDISTCVVE